MRLSDDLSKLAMQTVDFLGAQYGVRVKALPPVAELLDAVQKKKKKLSIPDSEQFVGWYSARLGELDRIYAGITTNEAIINAAVNKLFLDDSVVTPLDD